ncbi:MAG: hypothetical protein IIY16_07880 [Oscillospiraceae bacterium]|nr:hypothetical protein [Oscillospiraceae bacterium]
MNRETIRLLRECDSGVKMAVASINDVIGRVEEPSLREHLTRSCEAHTAYGQEMARLMNSAGFRAPAANPIARSMAKMKTSVKLALHPGDSTVADLMTDGCNMGIRSLSRYLNRNPEANAQSREMARRLIGLEDGLADGLRDYL